MTTRILDKAAMQPTVIGVGAVWDEGLDPVVTQSLWNEADWTLFRANGTRPVWPDIFNLPIFERARTEAFRWCESVTFCLVLRANETPFIFPTADPHPDNNEVDRFFHEHPKATLWHHPAVKLVVAPRTLPYPQRRFNEPGTLEAACAQLSDFAVTMRMANQVLTNSVLLTKYAFTNAAILTGSTDCVSPTRHARFFATTAAELCRGGSVLPVHLRRFQQADPRSVPRLMATVPAPSELNSPIDLSVMEFYGWEARDAVEQSMYWLHM